MPRRTSTDRRTAKRANPLDTAGITHVDYEDTDLLRRFISDRGEDPQPPGDPCDAPAAAADGTGRQERA